MEQYLKPSFVITASQPASYFINEKIAYAVLLGYVLVCVMGEAKILQIGGFGPSTMLIAISLNISLFLIVKNKAVPEELLNIKLFYFLILAIITQAYVQGAIENNPEALKRFIGRAVLTPILLFNIFSHVDPRKKIELLRKLGTTIIFIAIMGALLSFIQYFTVDEAFYIFKGSDQGLAGHLNGSRVYGLSSKPYLWAMFIVFVLGILIAAKPELNKNLFAGILTFLILSLLATESRSVILACIVITLSLPLLKRTAQLNNRWPLTIVITSLLIAPMVAPVIMAYIVNHFDITNLGSFGKALTTASISHRLFLADIISSYLSIYPTTSLGYGGFSEFSVTSEIRYLSTIRAEEGAAFIHSRKLGPHNFYLTLLIELGICLFIIFMAYIIKLQRYLLTYNPNSIVDHYKYNLGCAFLILFFSGIGQNNEETSILWSIIFFNLLFKNIRDVSTVDYA